MTCERLTEIFFDKQGVECARYDLCPAEGRFALQIPKGMWHTVIVKEPCVIFEVKDGAFKPLTSDDVWCSNSITKERVVDCYNANRLAEEAFLQEAKKGGYEE